MASSSCALLEFFLLGLAGVDEGEAMNVLRDLDVDAEKIREAVVSLLSGLDVKYSRAELPRG